MNLYSCKATQKTIPKFQFSNFLHEAFDQIPVHWCKCDVNEHGCQQLRIKNLFCVANFTLSVTYVPLFNPFYCSYFVVEWISTKASMSLQNLELVIHCHQSLSIFDYNFKKYCLVLKCPNKNFIDKALIKQIHSISDNKYCVL